MRRDELVGTVILLLGTAAGAYLLGNEQGNREADRRWQNIIATDSPFAPPKLDPVNRFAAIEGFTMNCLFDNSGKREDVVLWDGELSGKDDQPSKTCHAINERVIGELEADVSGKGVGRVQLYRDAKRPLP